MQKIIKVEQETVNAIDLLAQGLSISKMECKRLVQCGGVWITQKNKTKRLRRNDYDCKKDERLEVYYDSKIVQESLNVELVSSVREIYNFKTWGVWYKPPGILSCGTKYGDSLSLLRIAEKAKRKAYLIHRLDREANGVVILAYDEKMAARLCAFFEKRQLQKYYRVEVLGIPFLDEEGKGTITLPLDDKDCLTQYRLLKKKEKTSLLDVQLITGRKHQIRRHFALNKNPVMGDPNYGHDNKNEEGLKLECYKMILPLPELPTPLSLELPIELSLFREELK